MMRRSIAVAVLLVLVLFASPAFARGRKVIPQVCDGGGYKTLIKIGNISSYQQISRYKVGFFKNDGSWWQVGTNLWAENSGVGWNVITLPPKGVLLIETSNLPPDTSSGYAVIKDEETGTSPFPTDYSIGVSVVFEKWIDGKLSTTVSVPVTPATNAFQFPVNMDTDAHILMGFAIACQDVNGCSVTLTLTPSDGSAPLTASFFLTGRDLWDNYEGGKRSEFLDQYLFPGLKQFDGLLEGTSQGAVNVLALTENPGIEWVQYGLVAPVMLNQLAVNTTVQLFDDASATRGLDVDTLTTDYFGEVYAPGVDIICFSAQFRFSFEAINGAKIVYLGNMPRNPGVRRDEHPDDFDKISTEYLPGYTYHDQEFSQGVGSVYAIISSEGNYAKMRIIDIVSAVDSFGISRMKSLIAEVYTFK